MKLFSIFATALILSVPVAPAVELPTLWLAGELLPAVTFDAPLKQALSAPLVTVVDKTKPSPTGDNHDYVSYARYWWPDPSKPDGVPFIRKDGQHNREQVEAGDRAKVDHLVGNLNVFALAWSRNQDAAAAKRAGEWLRAWFVAPATRMNPNLDHSQVRVGHNNNLGNAPGVLDTRDFAEVVAAIRLLEGSPALSAEDSAAIRTWFNQFFDWLQTAPSGRGERAAENNHGSWFLVQAAAIAHFLGRDAEARALCEEDKARIAKQFAADGGQPLEMEREDALHYHNFNLIAQLRLALQARALGIDLWGYTAPAGGSLKKGVDFIRPFQHAPEKWPGKQKNKVDPRFMDEVIALAAKLDAGR
jgi:hypothetical protein